VGCNALSCDKCKKWIHVKCTALMTYTRYRKLVKNDTEFDFTCDKCTQYPCTVCNKEVTFECRAIDCDVCDKWTHIECTNSFTADEYDILQSGNLSFNFVCWHCSPD